MNVNKVAIGLTLKKKTENDIRCKLAWISDDAILTILATSESAVNMSA